MEPLPIGPNRASMAIGGWGLWEAPLLSQTLNSQNANEAVRKAKRALKDAEHRFDIDCGPDNASTIIAEIKVAEKRLAEATAKLHALDT